MAPPLGDLHAIKAQVVRPGTKSQDDVGARLEGSEPHAEAHALTISCLGGGHRRRLSVQPRDGAIGMDF